MWARKQVQRLPSKGDWFTLCALVVVTFSMFRLWYPGIDESITAHDDAKPLGHLVAIVVILLVYHVLWENLLSKDVQGAPTRVQHLQDKLLNAKAEDVGKEKPAADEEKKEIRIFLDGAFDLMHYGHMNAFRLGRSLGTHLVVAINSDASITQCKGAPLMKEDERLAMVKACKFVDEVTAEPCPYIMSSEYLKYVIEKYNIDYVVHGDDLPTVDGQDVYAAAKESGKFQTIPRTEGVSTTEIMGRMLLLNKDHHYCKGGMGQQSKFLTTSRMLRLFSADVKAPTPGMRVIYMDGAWDMFHCGHVAILKAAKERGDYLIVGVHSDTVVNRERGANLPLMNLHERVLSVLGCRYVDDVVIDAPFEVTREMVASLNIAEIVDGTNGDNIGECRNEGKRYRYPREAGILTILESPSDFNLAHLVERIQKNQEAFQAKFDRKTQSEQEYYDEKYGEWYAKG